ncbi:Crp/Fnr family transcriptional regulator [Sphingomonas sp. Xoc002]|uniref:Crp/Fnr family transcriptional regulator n=1 Tax=Sphingomonas sp. Xoc002 TaxID=2837624 RepID=UPI003D180E10
MTFVSSRNDENLLVAALPASEREGLLAVCEAVDLPFRMHLQKAEEPLSHIWFFRSGVGSTVSTMIDGATVELGTTGREGFIGIPALMGVAEVPQNVFVQIPGHGLRLSVAKFTDLLDRLPSLRALLLRYTLAFMTQISQGAACNRLHAIEARCARWLLMTHDRVDGDHFPLTQEFLGHMLGVTRPSVSIAAGMLQKAGYIRYVRGTIEVIDRQGLESATCECYGVINREFGRALG